MSFIFIALKAVWLFLQKYIYPNPKAINIEAMDTVHCWSMYWYMWFHTDSGFAWSPIYTYGLDNCKMTQNYLNQLDICTQWSEAKTTLYVHDEQPVARKDYTNWYIYDTSRASFTRDRMRIFFSFKGVVWNYSESPQKTILNFDYNRDTSVVTCLDQIVKSFMNPIIIYI